MAKRNGIAGDLFKITATLPWWVGIALAVAIYVLLQPYAVLETPIQVAPGQINSVVAGQMGRTFAYYGQYILPLLFLSGALASFFKQHKRKNLVRTVGSRKTDDPLHDINWKDFELLVGEVFRMRGFTVVENDSGGTDGGIDLVLKKDGEVFLVQCKQWRAYKVSVNIVLELLGVIVTKGAAGGFVVTSGVFTSEARSFAKGQNIELIDGSMLTAMIEKAHGVTSSKVDPAKKNAPESIPSATTAEPICPQCGNAMIKRVARKGANSGKNFWGCVEFPRCRGIRAIS
ncbi:restriction endonuclease [Nitrosomonas sp.]|uniref:restriction endonuclease n=1 Tax=Nitrosomonas sp. TaxID=42353 RepID=UPI001D6D5A78|nr:restriction endonuclease [Nitrosomonas sp.]MBX3618101.1 restriction endonuclease [Nitrosomonas sp.]